jgi:hypothetical protein
MIKFGEILEKVGWVFDIQQCSFRVYYSLGRVTYFNDLRRFPRLIDGFNAILPLVSCFFFIRYRSPIVP